MARKSKTKDAHGDAPDVYTEAELIAMIAARPPEERPTLRILLGQVAHARAVCGKRAERITRLKAERNRRIANGELLDRAAPSDYESERAVLAGILRKAGVIDEKQLTESLFHDYHHQIIFREFLALRDAGIPLDVAHVYRALREKSDDDTAWVASELAEVLQYNTYGATLNDHVRRLRDRRARRAVLAATIEAIKDVHDREMPTATVVERYHQRGESFK